VSALIPDGYFVDDHLVWGDLGRGGILSRGYRFQFPDNSASDDDAFIELEDNIRKILASCQRDERLQLQFYTSSDYEGPLARYQEQTKNAKSPRTIAIREELVKRYRARVEEETLLRTECRLYLSTKLARLTSEIAHMRDLMGYWSPAQGRKAEDGPIDSKYPLKETPSASYLQWTEWNVRDSDATVLFSIESTLTGGSFKTVEFARKHQKPCTHLCAGDKTAANTLRGFVEKHGVKVLNAAGPRASKEPGVGEFVMRTLEQAFGER
jgi:hypothetical protein